MMIVGARDELDAEVNPDYEYHILERNHEQSIEEFFDSLNLRSAVRSPQLHLDSDSDLVAFAQHAGDNVKPSSLFCVIRFVEISITHDECNIVRTMRTCGNCVLVSDVAELKVRVKLSQSLPDAVAEAMQSILPGVSPTELDVTYQDRTRLLFAQYQGLPTIAETQLVSVKYTAPSTEFVTCDAEGRSFWLVERETHNGMINTPVQRVSPERALQLATTIVNENISAHVYSVMA